RADRAATEPRVARAPGSANACPGARRAAARSRPRHGLAPAPERPNWYPRRVSAAAGEEAVLAPAEVGEGAARPDVSVVVTVFNEARNVDDLVERLERALDAWGRP